jgi:hypothetical protein
MWLSGPGKIAASTQHFSLLPEEDRRKRPASDCTGTVSFFWRTGRYVVFGWIRWIR